MPLFRGWGKQKLAGTQVLDRMWLKKIIPQYRGNKVLNPRIWDYVYQFHAPAGVLQVMLVFWPPKILTWSGRPCLLARKPTLTRGSIESWQRIGRLIRREIFNDAVSNVPWKKVVGFRDIESPNWQEKYHLYTTYILPIGLLYATDPTY